MLNTILRDRYKITKLLGQGGFGQTFLAEDLDLPGHPICVVKQLQPQSNSPVVLQTAKRLFNSEAEVLYRLSNHSQIPRLLAHFEQDGQFYLVQEFIDGQDLSKEIRPGEQWTEDRVVSFLADTLKTLDFVHQQNVIHRDIKPANLIRRQPDGKLVLIDFGAVKEIQTLAVNPQGQSHSTIVVGTPGYMPNEQQGGKPRFSSDIYALGMTAIQALTGIFPERLPEDPETGEVQWRQQVWTSDRLAAILDKMVRSHFRDRYQSVGEVVYDLNQLLTPNNTLSQAQTQPQLNASPMSDKPKKGGLGILAVGFLVLLTAGATFAISKFILAPQTASQPNTNPPTTETVPTPSEIPTVISSSSPESTSEASSPPVISPPISSPVAIEASPLTPLSSPTLSPTVLPTNSLPTTSPTPLAVSLPPGQNAVPLTRMKCLTTSARGDKSFHQLSEDITIGQEVVTAIAVLSSSSNYIDSTPAGVACVLISPDINSRFKRLNLTFGISNTNDYTGSPTDGTTVGLTVYLDKKNIGSKEVVRGQKQFWQIDQDLRKDPIGSVYAQTSFRGIEGYLSS